MAITLSFSEVLSCLSKGGILAFMAIPSESGTKLILGIKTSYMVREVVSWGTTTTNSQFGFGSQSAYPSMVTSSS